MADDSDFGFEQQLTRLSGRIGLAVSAAGFLVLCGWAFDIPLLKSLSPGLATMKVNTAIGFVLGGASLRLASPRAGRPRARRFPVAWRR